MLNLLHKTLYTGIGLAALTEQKAKEIVAELEKQGEVTAEEGKRLAQELIDKAKAHSQELRRMVDDEVKKVTGQFKFVKRADLEALEQRIAALEARLAAASANARDDDTL